MFKPLYPAKILLGAIDGAGLCFILSTEAAFSERIDSVFPNYYTHLVNLVVAAARNFTTTWTTILSHSCKIFGLQFVKMILLLSICQAYFEHSKPHIGLGELLNSGLP